MEVLPFLEERRAVQGEQTICENGFGAGFVAHQLVSQIRRQRPAAVGAARTEALAALRAAFEREHARKDLALHRLDLALDGSAVMEILGCGPGPEVGRALRFLTERVIEDPALNTRERLRELLLAREPGSGG